MTLYILPALTAVALAITLVVSFWAVSIRSGGLVKTTPVGEDAHTPLGATDEQSDAPPSPDRVA